MGHPSFVGRDTWDTHCLLERSDIYGEPTTCWISGWNGKVSVRDIKC